MTNHLAVHFTSRSNEWETPQALFDRYNGKHRFDLDVCATRKTAKCRRFFSPQTDGLIQSWEGHTCWMNPPYGRKIASWTEKAALETSAGDCTVVALLPARTDTGWFQDWVFPYAKLEFLRGRVKFLFGGQEVNPAPFPSVIAEYRAEHGSREEMMNDLEKRYPILCHFRSEHLPPNLQAVSETFRGIAFKMARTPQNPETAAGLRKLLEAKDCFVRAALL